MRDEYGEYSHVKCLSTIHDGEEVLFLKDEIYEVYEIWKADRLLVVQTELEDIEATISLDDEDFDLIEEDEDE